MAATYPPGPPPMTTTSLSSDPEAKPREEVREAVYLKASVADALESNIYPFLLARLAIAIFPDSINHSLEFSKFFKLQSVSASVCSILLGEGHSDLVRCCLQYYVIINQLLPLINVDT